MQFEALQTELREFAEERDWEQFHSPKNLSMALSVEASELLEIFQWMSEGESKSLSKDHIESVAQEIADIQIYLARIADILEINISEAVATKLQINRAKYPPDKVKGSSKKYTSYEAE